MQPQKTWNEGFGELLDQEMMEAFLTLPPLVLIRFNALIQKHIETTIAEERKRTLIEVKDKILSMPDKRDPSKDITRLTDAHELICWVQDALKELN